MTFLKDRILITRAGLVFGGRYRAEDKRNHQSFHGEASRHFYTAGDNLALALLAHYFRIPPQVEATRLCVVSAVPLTTVRLRATVAQVKIQSFAHKGLRRLYEDDAAKGVPPDAVDRLRKMLAFLDDMEDLEELRLLPFWKVHTLTGDRKGTWSLSVTANRRSTFRVDTEERAIYDINLEDYH
jgi:proteic killer suppression protein